MSYTKSSDHPHLFVRFDNGIDIRIGVSAWGADDALVTLRAWLVRPTRLDREQLRWLLERNLRQRLGALAIDRDGDILFSHALGGATLDQAELRDALYIVQVAAARLRSEILTR